MPIIEAEALEHHCTKFNYSKAGFIREAIQEKIQNDLRKKAKRDLQE